MCPGALEILKAAAWENGMATLMARSSRPLQGELSPAWAPKRAAARQRFFAYASQGRRASLVLPHLRWGLADVRTLCLLALLQLLTCIACFAGEGEDGGRMRRVLADARDEAESDVRRAAVAVAFLPVLGQWGLALCAKVQDNKASALAAAAVSVALALVIGSVLLLVHAAAATTSACYPDPIPKPCP